MIGNFEADVEREELHAVDAVGIVVITWSGVLL
jgi:hypothetical protein